MPKIVVSNGLKTHQCENRLTLLKKLVDHRIFHHQIEDEDTLIKSP
jgi:hypothetical protein